MFRRNATSALGRFLKSVNSAESQRLFSTGGKAYPIVDHTFDSIVVGAGGKQTAGRAANRAKHGALVLLLPTTSRVCTVVSSTGPSVITACQARGQCCCVMSLVMGLKTCQGCLTCRSWPACCCGSVRAGPEHGVSVDPACGQEAPWARTS